MRKKILIVEDYADSRSFMKALVENLGYQALEASNGIDAIKIVRHDEPDLVLMDLGMPDIDGLATTKIIRELKDGEPLPIIAVTAYGIDESQTLEAGCNELIFKPFDSKSLESILAKYLSPQPVN